MVAEERREKAEAKKEKVERLRKNVMLQEKTREARAQDNSVHQRRLDVRAKAKT